MYIYVYRLYIRLYINVYSIRGENMSYENLCMNCMRDIGDAKQCPHCRFIAASPQLPPFLPHRTIVGNRYLLGNVTTANGDGATYIAFDLERKAVVTVREFLPDTLITRTDKSPIININLGKEKFYASCLTEFLDMWRKLARMRGLSALVLVIDIIEENNTAYAVCEHIPGTISLRDYLLSGTTGYMSWEEARMMFMPVLSTLSTLHSAGIIHRGISPNTLFITPDRKIRIGGFSIPECRNVNSGIAAEIFAGYAPVEQFGLQVPSGPWTDIYAFAAVLYRALIGSSPIDSTVRMNSDRMMIPAKFAEQIPAYVINALINALQIMPEDRTKTVDQFRAELSASPTDAMAADYERQVVNRHIAASNMPRRANQSKAPNATAVKSAPAHKPVAKSSTPAKAAQDKRPAKKISASQAEENKRIALISGGIAAAVAIIIFIILCCTVLKDNIGFGTGADATTTSASQSDEAVVVPNFVGRTYDSISSQKTYRDNFEFEVTEEYNSDVKKGYVISQDVAAESSVNKGAKINLVVSLGVEQITMINVVGNTYEEAEAKLTEAGFKCEKIDKTNNGSHTSGTVASASLQTDKQYSKGTVVKLQVWKDPETSTAADAASSAQ